MEASRVRGWATGRRIGLLAGGAVVAGLLVAVQQWHQQPADGAHDEGRPDAYRVVGDGDLPTSRPPLGAPRDALSPEEVGYAIHLATSDTSIPTSTRDVLGKAGPEVLLVGLPDEETAGRRIAVVSLYDYAADRGYQQRVDLASGAVTSRHARGLQATISPTEAEVAIQIAIDQSAGLRFATEFEAAQGAPLVAPEQVHFVAGTFRFDGSTLAGDACGRQRCAQLLLQLPSGAYLNTSDFVVNLSTRDVVRINAGAAR
ncbi:hypothetical protein NODU109028_15805 [Nocardioides dubius]|uniref:Uncharacterized protein n=1 Tax=Nocardioides dubius TaxID=317019 RepID=A0ABP4EJ70_9ACTN